MKQNELSVKLKELENLAYYARNMHRAWRKFEEVKRFLTQEQFKKLNEYLEDLDPNCPDYHTGTNRKDVSQKFSNYIKEIVERDETTGDTTIDLNALHSTWIQCRNIQEKISDIIDQNLENIDSLKELVCYSKELEEFNNKVDLVLNRCNSTPDGQFRDADTIFADIMEEAAEKDDGWEITGIGAHIVQLYKNTTDRYTFETLFEVITGTTFKEYINRCNAIYITVRDADQVVSCDMNKEELTVKSTLIDKFEKDGIVNVNMIVMNVCESGTYKMVSQTEEGITMVRIL